MVSSISDLCKDDNKLESSRLFIHNILYVYFYRTYKDLLYVYLYSTYKDLLNVYLYRTCKDLLHVYRYKICKDLPLLIYPE